MLRKFGILTLAMGFVALLPGLARADNLDKKLNDSAPEIVKYIKDKGYKNVGILRFRAQRGDRPESFSTGPINGNLAERMENLLVIHAGDEKGPTFGVIHEAGSSAQQAKVGSWFSNAGERTKLFDVNYPLAWGTDKVKADAFLTGKVATSADLKKTTVTIQAFSKASLTPAKVVEFTVATDASLVRDLGYSFALTTKQKSGLVKSRSTDDEGELVLEQANKQQPPQQPKPTPDNPTPPPEVKPVPSADPKDIAGIEVKVLSGKDAVDLRQTGTQWELDCPPKGKPITITLTNKSTKQMGVVLKVAGMNTIGQQKLDSVECRKWVIPAGETYTIEGYHVGEKFEKLRPFVALDGDDADKVIEETGDKAQTIQVDVFEAVAIATKRPMSISRGMAPRAKGQPVPTYAELRDEILTQSNLKRVRSKDGKWVIASTDKDEKEGPVLNPVDFPKNPACVGSLQLRVMPPKTSGE